MVFHSGSDCNCPLQTIHFLGQKQVRDYGFDWVVVEDRSCLTRWAGVVHLCCHAHPAS